MQPQPSRHDSTISFPTLPASPSRREESKIEQVESQDRSLAEARMPPPSATYTNNSARACPLVTLPQRESVGSDDSMTSSAASSGSPRTYPLLSRAASATTLATSRPSSIASNTSANSQVQGQLTGCADLLSPGLASALGLVSLNRQGSGSSSRSRSKDPGAKSRVRAQSTQGSTSIARRPSMPTVPSMHHRMSVASTSSFDSLPEDESVHGFLAPANIPPRSKLPSHERPAQLTINKASIGSRESSSFQTTDVSTAASVPSSPTKRSRSPEDSTSHSSPSSGHSHENSQEASISPGSTISASSAPRPSAFLRRSATAPGNPTDLTLLMARRKRSARELLETERSFLASLTLIDQEYYQPLMASLGRGKSGTMSPPHGGTPILSRKSIGEIFSNFPDIMQLSQELLNQLEERFGQTFAKPTVKTADPTDAEAIWDPRSDSVGDILVTLAPFLKMYSLFVKNFSSALQRIEFEQKSNEAFAKFLKSTEKRRWDNEKISTGSNGRQAFGFGLGFQAHLLTVVQRIPRYKLLVDDLIKCTPQSHSDRSDLMRAGQVIEQVASYINDNVRQHEMVLTILSLQKSLQGLQEPLVVPGRVLIKRGTLMKTCRRNIQPREFFLFTDCLIYASPISGGIESASAAWLALAQKGGLYSGSNLTEQAPASPVVDPHSGGLSPIESVLEPASRLDPRVRTMSVPESYTPLAGAIFSLAGHQLQFRAKYPLRDCTVVGVEDSVHVGLRHCFEIRTPEKSFAVYAETSSSKEAWVTGIREARADFMSARRTLKADEDSIEAKRERRRSLYKLDAGKANNRRLSTQSLGGYLAGMNIAGSDQAISGSESEIAKATASIANTPQRTSLRSRVDSMPTKLRPPSFPSFPSSATNISLANLLASSSTAASAMPLRVLEDYNAPVWVPDNRADKCCNCSETFGIWRRKHHCRLCGQVVCWMCSQRSFLIPSYEEGEEYKPARACDQCYDSVFPSESPEEAACAVADESLPTSVDMASMPSTDGSVTTALSTYRLDSDADGSLGSPVTPVGEGSPGISRAESPLTDSSPTTYASSIAHAHQKAMGPKILRPKSLRFEDLSPTQTSDGDDILPLTTAATDTRTPQEMPRLPSRSKSLYSPSSRTSMPGMPHRSSALEAQLFTSHLRPQIQAATSGSGTFRLMTPRLTTPESELPPGQSNSTRRSLYAPSIMTAGYFGVDSTSIPEGVEDPSTPTSTSMSFTTPSNSTSASPAKPEVFRPSMMHAPNGVPPHLRSHVKRPMSAAARLSTFYGPLLTSERKK